LNVFVQCFLLLGVHCEHVQGEGKVMARRLPATQRSRNDPCKSERAYFVASNVEYEHVPWTVGDQINERLDCMLMWYQGVLPPLAFVLHHPRIPRSLEPSSREDLSSRSCHERPFVLRSSQLDKTTLVTLEPCCKVPTPGRVYVVRTRNSAKPSRASLIFWVGAHSKSHLGQINLTKSPVPRISTDRLKLSLWPGGTSSSPQGIRRPNPAAEIVMRATWENSSKPSTETHTAGLTVIVKSKTSSRTTSCFPCHFPSNKEVISLTDSSKASLLFFCESLSIHESNPVFHERLPR